MEVLLTVDRSLASLPEIPCDSDMFLRSKMLPPASSPAPQKKMKQHTYLKTLGQLGRSWLLQQ